MGLIDWIVVAAFVVILVGVSVYTRKLVKSAADFVAANRCAGRYILSAATAMAGLGAAVVISWFEMFYESGFPGQFWMMMGLPVIMVVTLSGWVTYRFRQTRCLTLMQFFERRYTRNLRIFYGITAFATSIVMIGIMPAVAGRFLINFLQLPQHIMIGTFELSLFPVVMSIILILALYFTLIGGQITVLVTDFLQGIFANIVCLSILVFILYKFDWSTIMEGLAFAPADASMVNPFKMSGAKNFSIGFFLVMAFNYIFVYPVDARGQSNKTSATTAMESRMAGVLSNLKASIIYMLVIMLAIIAFVVMHHPEYVDVAAKVNDRLAMEPNQGVHKQLITPLVLLNILPKGLLGMFCAFIIAAFISTADTILHVHGTMFIQDIVLPFRKKHMAPDKHLKILRYAVIAIAVMIFFYSLFYKQNLHIMMYFAIAAVIYAGGASACIIGGLYWSKGTTSGAWASAIISLVLGTTGLFVAKLCPDFPMTAQIMSFWVVVLSWVAYVVVSLVDYAIRGKKVGCDMDQLLNKGEFVVDDDRTVRFGNRSMLDKALGITDEFSKGDRWTYYAVMLYQGGWLLAIFVLAALQMVIGLSDKLWEKFWHVWVLIVFVQGVIVTVWFIIGGAKNLKELYMTLKSSKRDYDDDGIVDHGGDAKIVK